MLLNKKVNIFAWVQIRTGVTITPHIMVPRPNQLSYEELLKWVKNVYNMTYTWILHFSIFWANQHISAAETLMTSKYA